jgi:predicted nucleic acid-binding protein
LSAEWSRIGALVEQYGDFPLGGADASVIALTERLETDLVITLDRRHFRAVRPRHCPAFTLLPEG